ncbi:sensor histidine kinase [Dactylosporangium sp. NPDC000521]|uniref:sensor histidine kinase n=1 Tax=Dactylosporangium sp. NPDC000521 TaxID=3363975 RepID=UPI0036C8261F
MNARLDRLHVTRLDVVLTAVLTVAGLVQALVLPFAAPGVGELYVIGSTLPLAWRRRHPVEAAAVSSAFWLISMDGFPLLGFVTAMLQYYALGAYGSPRVAVWAVSVWACVTGVVGTLLGPEAPAAAIGAVLVVVAPVLAGRVVRRQRQQHQALLDLARELEAEKRKVQEAAVSEERARVARELHDVLGHELTLIAVQAEAASAALRLAPDRAAAPVEAIRETAHRTLREIRAALDVVAPPTDPTDATPAGLTDLARRAREAGIANSLTVTGTPWAGHTSVWLAVHRIVRECLTNAGRHAPGTPVTVSVHWAPDTVTVTAANAAGAGPPARSADGGRIAEGDRTTDREGRGLAGMRHRAELLGGTFAATKGGGRFEVHVTLPQPGAAT